MEICDLDDGGPRLESLGDAEVGPALPLGGVDRPFDQGRTIQAQQAQRFRFERRWRIRFVVNSDHETRRQTLAIALAEFALHPFGSALEGEALSEY
jgi:hypothetical protein